jgi:cytochrome P450
MRVRAIRAPVLAALGVPIDPFAPAFRENPYPFYHRLRQRDPVYFARFGCWLVTGYAEAVSALREPRLGHPDYDAALLARPTALERFRSDLMLARNPPEHTRLRRAVTEILTPAVMEGVRPRAQALTDRLLDRLEPARRMDVIEDLAYPLALGTITDLLGVPAEDVDRVRLRVRDLAAAVFDFAPSKGRLEHGNAAASWLRDYFSGLLVERRSAPRADVLGALAEAERRGQLDAEELLATSILLLTAGYETTVGLIGNGVLALLRHPDALRRLREDLDLIRSAVEEFLRYDSPVQSFGRIALEDVPLGDKLIRRGQQVYVLTGAANRDPGRFPDPDRLDITRQDNRHLGFGVGIHACLGQHLARAEAQVAIGTLVRRLGRMALLTERPTRHDSPHGRGLQTLPIAF